MVEPLANACRTMTCPRSKRLRPAPSAAGRLALVEGAVREGHGGPVPVHLAAAAAAREAQAPGHGQAPAPGVPRMVRGGLSDMSPGIRVMDILNLMLNHFSPNFFNIIDIHEPRSRVCRMHSLAIRAAEPGALPTLEAAIRLFELCTGVLTV